MSGDSEDKTTKGVGVEETSNHFSNDRYNFETVTVDETGRVISRHIGHDTNEWKTVTIEPDYCNVGGTVPFDSYATLDNGLVCSPDVIARGTEVYRQGDLYQGTQANAGAGIHSGVSQDAAQVRFLQGNSGVVVNNLPVIEQGRHALINTTPYGYSGAYSQTLTCAVPISSEQAMRNEIKNLSDYSQQINNNLIPGLNRKLDSLQEQYDNTSNWPWEDRDVKNSLSGQIKRTKNSITGYQDTLIYNRARTSELFNILEPNGTFMSSQPSWNEQQAINRVIERQQRAIQNLENWRTGPVLAGPAMFANAHGAPIEVVENLRAAGEGLGVGAVGLRGRAARSDRGSALSTRNLTYRPTGTYIKPSANATQASVLVMSPKKFNYLLGRVVSGEHNTARSTQLAKAMRRLGLPLDKSSESILTKHFMEVINTNNNIINTFTKRGQILEVRQSFFIGPSGKATVFETTFEVMSDGVRRFVTTIPKEGEK